MRQIGCLIVLLSFIYACKSSDSQTKSSMNKQVKIIFLHRSTGKSIWRGGTSRLFNKIFNNGDVIKWFDQFNNKNNTDYKIEEAYFPKVSGVYGYKNYPYDYYNIWVKNGGEEKFKDEPTLEFLTKKYNVIIWKHCHPVCNIMPDSGFGDVNSEEQRIENYKLQYMQLKEKMKSFPDTKFIVWTGAALTRETTTPEMAQRAKEFFTWVKDQWDTPGDNIYLWDFYELETEGGLYLKDEYATNTKDPHPNQSFAARVAPFFCKRIVDVIEGRGDISSKTGQ
jgi:hypothetical protein